MLTIPHATSNIMLLFKALLISTTVLLAAIELKFYFPAITDFAVHELPCIYNGIVSWLRPPYLYLVLNCIIITIVASSKLQSEKDDDVSLPPPPVQPIPTLDALPPQPAGAPEVKISPTDYPTVDLGDRSGYDTEVEKGSDFDTFEFVDASRSTGTEQPDFSVDPVDDGVAFAEDVSSNKENEYAISKSSLSTAKILNSKECSSSSVKPPVSATIGHRRNIQSSSEGGKAALGVSKPKRNDTLECTWKAITEGRPIPLSRHLRKSDTWERGSADTHHGRPQEKTMTKSETFSDRTNARRSPSPSGTVRKEPSLSQEELNRRVEAFINKFNEEMRLQRQESLNQYLEMIRRGSH